MSAMTTTAVSSETLALLNRVRGFLEYERRPRLTNDEAIGFLLLEFLERLPENTRAPVEEDLEALRARLGVTPP